MPDLTSVLFWIAVKLLPPEHDDEHGNIDGGTALMAAIKTISWQMP